MTTRSDRDYTPEQERIARQVIASKCYYSMFSVDKNANESEIKKSYRKLALQLHPDKNSSPSAEEAFKKISKAFQCLNDSNKRYLYDQHGEEEPTVSASSYRGCESDGFLSPEDLFAYFMGANFGSGHSHVFRRVNVRPHRAREQTDNNQRGMLFSSMLPVLLLLIVSFLSSSFTPTRHAYSLHQNHEYPIRRHTTNIRTSFYVNHEFTKHYPINSHALQEVELRVEREHIKQMSEVCDNDQSRRVAAVRLARSRKEYKEADRIKSAPLESCDRWKHYKTQFPHLAH
eukprot:GHVR01025940.1.p1 GENE.GHVR01025940.1~~GHVR01025940.1.p1  ORF type:complete len:287 (-),score=41.86 GHVR01025940.1:566-1426(-)